MGSATARGSAGGRPRTWRLGGLSPLQGNVTEGFCPAERLDFIHFQSHPGRRWGQGATPKEQQQHYRPRPRPRETEEEERRHRPGPGRRR